MFLEFSKLPANLLVSILPEGCWQTQKDICHPGCSALYIPLPFTKARRGWWARGSCGGRGRLPPPCEGSPISPICYAPDYKELAPQTRSKVKGIPHLTPSKKKKKNLRRSCQSLLQDPHPHETGFSGSMSIRDRGSQVKPDLCALKICASLLLRVCICAHRGKYISPPVFSLLFFRKEVKIIGNNICTFPRHHFRCVDSVTPPHNP